MTLIDKIKNSVEGATGFSFFYHAAGEINELIARAERLPVAFAFLLDSGTIEDVNGRYHERVTLAVMFADKTQFDFNALENEEIIDRMKIKAYKWLESLRNSNDLQIISVNSTQRLYDTTTDILTGYAVSITLQDMQGVGECELPEVVIPITENGIHNVVGADKVIVSVPNSLIDLVATENGKEYLPSDYGVHGFNKVKTEIQKVKVTSLLIDQFRSAEPLYYWDGRLIDVTYLSTFSNFARYSNIKEINIDGWECIYANFNFNAPSNIRATNCFYGSNVEHVHGHFKMKVSDCGDMFRQATQLKSVDVTGIDVSETISVSNLFYNCHALEQLDLTTWILPSTRLISNYCFVCRKLNSVIGGRNINDVLQNDIAALRNNHTAFSFTATQLDRASLRAIINGLADLSGEEAQILTLGATLMAKLTDEDIAIATNKNWTIA